MNANSITAPDEGLKNRHRTGAIWQVIFLASTTVGIVALSILLLSILDQVFGYAAVQNKVEPATLSSQPLENLSKDELVKILADNVSSARFKTLEKARSFGDRSWNDVYNLVEEQVIQPKVVKSYRLFESLFERDRIQAAVSANYPDAELIFKSWLSSSFVANTMSSRPEIAGIRTSLLGSLWLIFLTILLAFPIGVGAAIYLEEYAGSSWINRFIQTNIDNLAGVPSIIYGILGLAIFVRGMSTITSGALFGEAATDSANGRTILAAALTMALLILPILIINAQEAIRAVPNSLRQASFGLGATKWQTIWHHVLPSALPGILTGTILAVSRAIGETAPLIIVGASSFITSDPNSVFSSFTALPIQIYNWTTRPQDQFRNIAAAAIIVLLVALLSLNAAAILLRNRFNRRSA